MNWLLQTPFLFSEEAQALGKIRQVSVASMVAETIRRINNEESISAMFDSYL